MADYEQQQQFYQQFNTVVHLHQEWLHSKQGTLEVLKDPWKAQPPTVRIESPFEENKARDILKMIRDRHTNAGTYTPP